MITDMINELSDIYVKSLKEKIMNELIEIVIEKLQEMVKQNVKDELK
jgi:hypothetical protein